MKKPTFLLIGISGLFNYGCEAIVRGTENILTRAFPDSDIVYASRRPADDKRRLAGSRIRIIERKHPRYSFKNITRKALAHLGLKWDPRLDSLKLLAGIDIVLSIGGDLYTLDYNNNYSMSLPKFGDEARKRKIPYILWGASVGPFSTNPAAEAAYSRHLRRLSFISAREATTVDYLSNLGITDNVIPCADPAFVVAPEISKEATCPAGLHKIGINLSPLSAFHSTISYEQCIAQQASVIRHLIQATKAQVLLIPHVVCDFDEKYDDSRYLWQVLKAVGPDFRANLSILEADPGFIGTKRELVKCDLVIASRMHCAINALSACVPTILVSYSQKAVGMAEYVYGNRDWLVGIDDVSPEEISLMACAMLDRSKEIQDHLSKRMVQIRLDAYYPTERLKAELGHLTCR